MNYSWDLSELCKNEEEFNKGVEEIKSFIPHFKEFEGKLSDDKVLKEYFLLNKEVEFKLSKLYQYAHSLGDLNRKDLKSVALEGKIRNVLMELISATSFIDPEILSLDKAHLEEFFKKNPEVDEFDFSVQKLFDGNKYVLSKDKEALLSNFNELSGAASSLYSSICVSDYSGKEIEIKGEKVNVNVSNWTALISDKSLSEEDRQRIFEALYEHFDKNKNTLANIYKIGLDAQMAEVKSRGYNSIVESHLEHNHIPLSVLTNLIEVARNSTEPIKKYYALRTKALNLSKPHTYDRFLSLAESESKFTYEEAKELFFKSIERFPKDFQDKAHFVTSEGRVDVYPKDGKRSGAYSNGGGDIKPFILLNFLGNLDDVFTLAHESGHSIHTMYSIENQKTAKQHYQIFVAEIASTFNEHNLLDYLLKQDSLSKKDKIALIQKAIEDILGTFYRQTLFGEYELEISEAYEKGEVINYEVLSNKMIELYKHYYDIDIKEEVYKPLVWAYIPHLFYTPFYVYQYATSFAASLEFYKRVNEGSEEEFDKYISLLKMGGSDYPVEEVKKAGVDLTTKKPFEAVADRLKMLVDQLEELLK